MISSGDKICRKIMRDDSIVRVSRPMLATGGQITYSGDWVIHTFTEDGEFEVLVDGLEVEYLIVGGGGAGGCSYEHNDKPVGGGGGGGGVLYGATDLHGDLPVKVGGGGQGNNSNGVGLSGQNSSLGSWVAIGGSGGGSGTNRPPVGGSGGGSGAMSRNVAYGYFGQGTYGQGHNGGRGSQRAGGVAGGGGGGATGLGGNGATSINEMNRSDATGGSGGPGFTSDISGALSVYGGGGGGAAYGHHYTPYNEYGRAFGGVGGSGGGGKGGESTGGHLSGQNPEYDHYASPTPGAPGTGGGGGGASHHIPDYPEGAPGGSGIVIIRYKADASPVKTYRLGPVFYGVSGGIARFDARAYTNQFVSEQYLSVLTDRSGNDNHGIERAGYNTAVFKKSSARVLSPNVKFDSSVYELPDAFRLEKQTPWTRYTVIRLELYTGVVYSWEYSGTTRPAYRFSVLFSSSGLRPELNVGGNLVTGPAMDLTTNPVIVTVSNDGTNSSMWIDGEKVIDVVNGTRSAPPASQAPFFGAYGSGSSGNPARLLSGNLFDDITYLGAHDDPTREMIEANLRSEWSWLF